MGMSTYAVGVIEADEKWNKMKAIWDSCNVINISPPNEVLDFFGGEYPGDSHGRVIELGEAKSVWCNGYASGYEIDITKLPKDVRYIRFYNSW